MDCIKKLDSPEQHIYDLCASFQYTVTQTICLKAINACKLQSISELIVAGGVAANKILIETLQQCCMNTKSN